MENELEHLIVNHIVVEDEYIVVGATNDARWNHDLSMGMDGVDAKTIVNANLIDEEKNYCFSEQAVFHAAPGDPIRELSMSYLVELFEIAWVIKNEKLDKKCAEERYLGKVLIKN